MLLDSGADISVFTAGAADKLGLVLTDGQHEIIRGVTGSNEAWVHERVGIAVSDAAGNRVAIEASVAFMKGFPHAGVLGRKSFFDAFRVTIDERNHAIELDLHGDAENVVPWEVLPAFPTRAGDGTF